MKKYFLFLIVCSVNLYAQGGRLIPNPVRNIPRWARNEFFRQHLDERYSIVYRLYPYYLRGDFNGDRRRDVIVQVEEKGNGKLGFAIIHGKYPQLLETQISIIGAGRDVDGTGDDLKWVDMWSLVPRGKVRKLFPGGKIPSLIGDGITLSKRDERTGMIYWSGKRYEWQEIHVH